jgi:hypothetical protein
LLLSGFKAASANALTVGSFGSNRPVIGSGRGMGGGSGWAFRDSAPWFWGWVGESDIVIVNVARGVSSDLVHVI